MKNYQQTPKQIRKDFAKAKHKVRTSKPIKTFEQDTLSYWFGGTTRNIVNHIDGRR